MDDHAAAVDIGDRQRDHLGDPQPGSVDRRKRGTIADVGDRAEKTDDLLGRQNRRQRVGAPSQWQCRLGFRLAQGHRVEEAQRADDLVEGLRLQPARDEVKLVGSHVLEAELVGRPAVEECEVLDRTDIGLLGQGRHVPHPHVVDHALAQRRGLHCHGGNSCQGIATGKS